MSVDDLCNKHLSNDRAEALNAEVQHAEAVHYRYNAALWWRHVVTSLIVEFYVDCNHFWSLDLKSNTNSLLNSTLRYIITVPAEQELYSLSGVVAIFVSTL